IAKSANQFSLRVNDVYQPVGSLRLHRELASRQGRNRSRSRSGNRRVHRAIRPEYSDSVRAAIGDKQAPGRIEIDVLCINNLRALRIVVGYRRPALAVVAVN